MPELISLDRREAQDPPRAAVGREPERAVGPLAHVADALAQFLQEALLLDGLVAVELELHQNLAGERADKQAATPGRE